MSIEIHRHNWQQFRGWNRNEWRCTTAPSKAQLDHLCDGECDWRKHYEEKGCLATLVRWRDRGNYFFCAPGHPMVELTERPRRMVIDDEYLELAQSFHESLKQIAA